MAAAARSGPMPVTAATGSPVGQVEQHQRSVAGRCRPRRRRRGRAAVHERGVGRRPRRPRQRMGSAPSSCAAAARVSCADARTGPHRRSRVDDDHGRGGGILLRPDAAGGDDHVGSEDAAQPFGERARWAGGWSSGASHSRPVTASRSSSVGPSPSSSARNSSSCPSPAPSRNANGEPTTAVSTQSPTVELRPARAARWRRSGRSRSLGPRRRRAWRRRPTTRIAGVEGGDGGQRPRRGSSRSRPVATSPSSSAATPVGRRRPVTAAATGPPANCSTSAITRRASTCPSTSSDRVGGSATSSSAAAAARGRRDPHAAAAREQLRADDADEDERDHRDRADGQRPPVGRERVLGLDADRLAADRVPRSATSDTSVHLGTRRDAQVLVGLLRRPAGT